MRHLNQAMVPVVFFCLRFWGSIRAVLFFSYPSDSEEFKQIDGWLKYMQAICDPIQGFFNALLFVVTSKEGRANVVMACMYLARYFSPVWELLLRLKCVGSPSRSASATADSNEMSSTTFLKSDTRRHLIPRSAPPVGHGVS
jgi:hypothetical protein